MHPSARLPQTRRADAYCRLHHRGRPRGGFLPTGGTRRAASNRVPCDFPSTGSWSWRWAASPGTSPSNPMCSSSTAASPSSAVSAGACTCWSCRRTAASPGAIRARSPWSTASTASRCRSGASMRSSMGPRGFARGAMGWTPAGSWASPWSRGSSVWPSAFMRWRWGSGQIPATEERRQDLAHGRHLQPGDLSRLRRAVLPGRALITRPGPSIPTQPWSRSSG